jgi:RNA polymerase sigma-70 factor, ECF subfamily
MDGESEPVVQQVEQIEQQDITRLLQSWGNGNKDALDQLMPVVYAQLRKLAVRCLYSEKKDHTLRATALVHEVYMRLVHADLAFNDRVHFYALASRMLRHILVDHAKTQKREKRGGDAERIPLDEAVVFGPETSPEILELDEALTRLAQHDQRKADLIELLFFGGLTYDEAAEALKISPATVHRELKLAKAWLYRELS